MSLYLVLDGLESHGFLRDTGDIPYLVKRFTFFEFITLF